MKAIVVAEDESGKRLEWDEVADVTAGPGEVLVDIGATAVNRADLMQARGRYDPPAGASGILGLEMAGTVRTGDGRWQRGDRVCALLPGGGYAERVAVPSQMLMPVPDKWSFAEAAAIPEVWFTAYVNLILEGELQPGETVLIHAGGSGVGTAAVQLARVEGARVLVTAGTESKLEVCRRLGADRAINYKEQDFLDETLRATAGEGVDLILDPVGATYLGRNLMALRPLGRLVNIGSLSGEVGEMDMGHLLRKRLRLVGSTLRSRPVAEKIDITARFSVRYWPLLQSGQLRPVIDRILPVEEAQAAHEYVRQNRNTGKVVLAIRAEDDQGALSGTPPGASRA